MFAGYSISYKVNNGNLVSYLNNATYKEYNAAFTDLDERANAKGFKRISRAQGNDGIVMEYSNGKQRVLLILCCSDNERMMAQFLFGKRN